MDSEKELQQMKNRFRDLAGKSFSQNLFTFSGFLGLSEQSVLHGMENELTYAGMKLFGGDEQVERRMVRFGNPPELGYEIPFPIVCVHVKPIVSKFADDLSHRDFLGALMNLGIERSVLGDIRVGEKEAYLFCQEKIADFICENLTKVKHTHVKCELVEEGFQVPEEEPERIFVQVPSMRADAILAKVYNRSRENVLDLFRAQKVFVDGRLCENNSRLIRVGEKINARGYGKCYVSSEPVTTKKGKLSVEVFVYR